MKTCPYCAESIQDAAIACRYCGRDLDPTAQSIARSRILAESPAKKKTHPFVKLLAVGFGILGLMICRAATAPTPSGPAVKSTATEVPRTPQAPRVRLDGAVSFREGQFHVRNRNDVPWVDVSLQINAGIIDRGYEYTVVRVAPNEIVSVGALAFANSDGQRFNPFTTKPQRFTIRATINGALDIRSVLFE